MLSLAISYFKRYKMEIDLAGLPAPAWPAGFHTVEWRHDLFESHVDVLAGCFKGELDTAVFPSLGSVEGCRGLMGEIVRRRAFIPEATWLLVGPDGPCGTIQALRERGVLGAIQNVGVLPSQRGRGLARALLLQSLQGMYHSGLGRAVLEVTATNDPAVRLYARMGFRRSKVVYKAVPAASALQVLPEERPVQYVEEHVVQQVHQHTFANGLTLLAERMEHVRSAAMYFLVPAGCAHDPPQQLGLAGVLSEMIMRGAGPRDNRELTLALDNLGLDRSEGVGLMHTRFRGTTLARNLPAGLRIYADILRRPHLPEKELEACRALAIQDLQGLEDEPGTRVMVELRKHLYPPPLSNDHRGSLEGVEALTYASLVEHHKKFFHPDGSILSVTGNIDWASIRDLVGELFADWSGRGDAPLTPGAPPGKRAHLEKELEQTQIAIAYPSVPVGHADYYAALGAVNVLSGGMGSRLFTEIREKEGLCYAVGASYQPMKDRGAVVASAASLNHQAQRTLDKLFEELGKLPRGVEEEEVQRVRVGLKTALIMQQESTSARATALASDWYYLGRLRSFDEIQSAIQGLSARAIVEHVNRHPPGDFSVVTMGPQALTMA